MYKRAAEVIWSDIRGMMIGFLIPAIIHKVIQIFESALENISEDELLYCMDVFF